MGRRDAAPSGGTTYVLRLPWGLGDVLLTTPAIRALKLREPDCTVIFQTFVKGRRRLEYDPPGRPPGSGGAPDEMLWHNPYIDHIMDVDDRPLPPDYRLVEMYYVKYGGEPLDVPIQARYFERLGLPWDESTRFDAFYYVTPAEDEGAKALLGDGRFCALTPRCGWAGKMWTDEGWAEIIRRLRAEGWTPVVLAGKHVTGPPWDATINLSGLLDIRQTAAVIQRCEAMLCTEGGLSNLRFALGLPAVVMTCATKMGLQVWAPPELYWEVRNAAYCEPCMWRGQHVAGHTQGPPGNIATCPAGYSLREVPADTVWAALHWHVRHGA